MAKEVSYGKYSGDIKVEMPELLDAEAIAMETEDFESAWNTILALMDRDFFAFHVREDEKVGGYVATLMYTGNDKHRSGLTMRGGGDTWKLAVCVLVLKLDICPPEKWEMDLATKAKRLRGIR